jgi:hypothetical protein
MDPSISKLLDEIPEKPPRSKLELHADVIAALRQKRRTYSEIAEFFRDHLAITVAPSTIHDFVRVRRRRENGTPSPVTSRIRITRRMPLHRLQEPSPKPTTPYSGKFPQ